MNEIADWLLERLDRLWVALDGLPKNLQIGLLVANGAKHIRRAVIRSEHLD